MGGSITHLYPILSDYKHQAGSASGQYFHQDLLVASYIFQSNPRRHVDVGSRIDGFVAHVASFRPIEIIDIRKLESTGHKNIKYVQADLMVESDLKQADSISCLHAIEHFGLGRYGDPIDPNGHKKGFSNLLRMLEPEGRLYIGVPIGRKNEVHFNAHRVFHPLDILGWSDKHKFQISKFDYVDDFGNLHTNVDVMNNVIDVTYGCGIYTISKKI